MYTAAVIGRTVVLCALFASACDRPSTQAAGGSRAGRGEEARDAAAPDPEVVRFATSDGWQIVADLRARHQGGLAVVLVHQLSSNRGEWAPFATQLSGPGSDRNERRISTLTIDLRGHGESVAGPEGPTRWQSFGNNRARWVTLEYDVAAAVDYVRQRIGTTRIVLVASSIGATAAALFAARSGAPVVGLVMISPGVEYRGIDVIAPLRAFTERRGRLLLVTGAGDAYSADSTREIETALRGDAGARVEVERYDNASAHGVSLGAQGVHPEMWARIERFVQSFNVPRE